MLSWRVARLRVDNRKRVIWNVWNKNWGKRSQVPILEQKCTVNNLFMGSVVHLKDFFPQHQTCRQQQRTYDHPIQ